MIKDEDENMIVLTKGLDKCLFAIPFGEWNRIIDRNLSEYLTKEERYNIVRALNMSSLSCLIDSNKRIKVPDELAYFAEIDRKVTIVGAGDRFEIWNPENYLEHEKVSKFDQEEIIRNTLL